MGVEPSGQQRTGRELLEATKPFTEEDRGRTWFYVGSTVVLLLLLLTSAAVLPWIAAQIACSVLGGLVMVRAFILYHDFIHGSILRDSRMGRYLMYGIGTLLITPPRAWRQSHGYHHSHVGKLEEDKNHDPVVSTDIGSYPMMSLDMWRKATPFQRLHYRVSRHPLTIFCAYFSVFMYGFVIQPALADFRKHWPGIVILAAHISLIAGLWVFGGWDAAVFGYLLPLWIAAALGAYLFYAQHSFPETRVYTPDEWNFFDAALETASYFKFGPVMEWFTGSIGYHHIHHLRATIPFYRLKETMLAIPELQHPPIVRLRLADLWEGFQANLWDPENQRMISYAEAGRLEKERKNDTP